MLQVLLVDDEPFILQGLAMLIDWEKEGFTLAGTAANGLEAIAFLEKTQVDLIIADIKMPAMTGIELLEKIRAEQHFRRPILSSSAATVISNMPERPSRTAAWIIFSSRSDRQSF